MDGGWDCTVCSETNSDWSIFCLSCGAPRHQAAAAAPPPPPVPTRSAVDAEPEPGVWPARPPGAKPRPDAAAPGPETGPSRGAAAIAAVAIAAIAVTTALAMHPWSRTRHITPVAQAAPIHLEDFAPVTGATVPATTAPAVTAPDPVTQSASFNIGIADFPGDWKEQSLQLQPGYELPTDLSGCFRDRDPLATARGMTVRVFTPRDNSGLNVTGISMLMPDARAADDLISGEAEGVFNACLDHYLRTLASTAGAEIVGPVREAHGRVPGGANTTMRYGVKARGITVDIDQEQVAMASGPRLLVVTITAAGDPLPQDLRNRLVAAMGRHLG